MRYYLTLGAIESTDCTNPWSFIWYKQKLYLLFFASNVLDFKGGDKKAFSRLLSALKSNDV